MDRLGKALAFIESHLSEPTGVERIAAGQRPFHCQSERLKQAASGPAKLRGRVSITIGGSGR